VPSCPGGKKILFGMDSNFNIYIHKQNNNKIKIKILGLALAGTTLTACNSKDSMDMVHDSAAYGMGFPWHWIFGIIVVVLVVIIIVKLIKRNKKGKFDAEKQ
jgi:hypothetical protein